MVASHLFIGDEMCILVTDVSPICDELCVVMEMNSIYDERCWSWMKPRFGHNFPSAWLPDGAVNAVIVV
jgi:hypothetical protein